jgi:hypothetical protein
MQENRQAEAGSGRELGEREREREGERKGRLLEWRGDETVMI